MNVSEAPHSWDIYSPAQRWWYLFVLFLVCLSNYVDRHVMAVLIVPIKAEFGVSDAAMGLLTGFAFAATYAVLGIPFARWSDRGDRRIVITASLAIWSAATMLSGFVKSCPMLALTRLGVGVGEAGAVPPAQSLIADYFPPEQRTRAIALFMTAAAFGYYIAFAGGTRITEAYGWRWAFIALGMPGLLLCLLTYFGLSEPRRRTHSAFAASSEGFVDSLRQLAAKRSFVLIVAAMVLYFLTQYGAMTWQPTYINRVLGVPMTTIGSYYGLVQTAAVLVGSIAGSWIVDRLARSDPRAGVRVPAVALVLVWPLLVFSQITDSFAVLLAMVFLGNVAFGVTIPAMFAVLHRVCGSERRAMAVAVAFFFSNLLGLGFGPLITGALSDMLTARFGAVGLGYAITASLTILLPCAATLWLASNRMELDREE